MKWFITFGAGSPNYYEAGNRLINQANSVELFDKTTFYTDAYLKNDIDFWSKHSAFIENNHRGYGYWLWKPYVIKKTMEQMEDGDILLFLDCGCEIDKNKKEEISTHLELVKNEYIIGTSAGQDEQKYNKMDLIIKLNMLDNKCFLDEHQRQGGSNLFYVCDKTRNLVNEWYELACDYHNIDDSPSIIPNFSCFIDHRHDQSIFSLLTKKYDIYSRKYSLFDCTTVDRNKSGISRI
jgi:hypothetical protein